MGVSVQVYQAEHYEDVWQRLLKPWLKETQDKDISPHPSAVFLPYGAWEAYVKRSMVRESLTGFNVHFLTPGKMRVVVQNAAQNSEPAHSSEVFRCVAAAEAYLDRGIYSNAIYCAPENFVRACDKFTVGGHPLSELFPAEFEGFARKWEERIRGLNSVQKQDREAWKSLLKGNTLLFDRLFIAGFTGRDWGLFPLLMGAHCLARETSLCLPFGRSGLHEELWLGTWENAFGAAIPVHENNHNSGELRVEFLLGKTIVNEAEYIAKRALMASSPQEDVCIVVPTAGVLAQEIAEHFEREGIAYYDGLGRYPVDTNEERKIRAWLAFMKEPTLMSFINFLREEGLCSAEQVRAIEHTLKQARCDTLVDDIGLLKVYSLEQYLLTQDLQALLEKCSVPQPEDHFKNYFSNAHPFLASWFVDSSFENEGTLLSALLQTPIPHDLFLRWVESILQKRRRIRSASTHSPFSNIYLLSSEQADGLRFDTVILGGLNAGRWSGISSNALFEAENLIRSKNRWASVQGNQGEGHCAVRFPYAYILTEDDISKEDRSRQERLTQSARKTLILSACIASENDFKVSQPLDDCYQAVYNTLHGHYLGERELQDLLKQTLKQIPAEAPPAYRDCTQMQRAYRARRDSQNAFGPYEYAFVPSAQPGWGLSCSQWERCIKNPSDIWYERVAQARPEEEATVGARRRKVRGIWVHSWLVFFRDNAEFKAIPEGKLWEACILEKANEHRNHVEQAYACIGKELPDWWNEEWLRARIHAKALMNMVLDAKDFPFFAQEFSLPKAAFIQLGENSILPLSGRIDLIFSREGGSLDQLESPDLWVVDFKTGTQGALTLKNIAKGEGLQLVLYASALQQEGAKPVGMSIFGMQDRAKTYPQLTLDRMNQLEPIWDFMRTVQATGILGQRTQVRSRFTRRSHFPIATLVISQKILDEKWGKTHPGFVTKR